MTDSTKQVSTHTNTHTHTHIPIQACNAKRHVKCKLRKTSSCHVHLAGMLSSPDIEPTSPSGQQALSETRNSKGNRLIIAILPQRTTPCLEHARRTQDQEPPSRRHWTGRPANLLSRQMHPTTALLKNYTISSSRWPSNLTRSGHRSHALHVIETCNTIAQASPHRLPAKRCNY